MAEQFAEKAGHQSSEEQVLRGLPHALSKAIYIARAQEISAPQEKLLQTVSSGLRSIRLSFESKTLGIVRNDEKARIKVLTILLFFSCQVFFSRVEVS